MYQDFVNRWKFISLFYIILSIKYNLVFQFLNIEFAEWKI